MMFASASASAAHRAGNQPVHAIRQPLRRRPAKLCVATHQIARARPRAVIASPITSATARGGMPVSRSMRAVWVHGRFHQRPVQAIGARGHRSQWSCRRAPCPFARSASPAAGLDQHHLDSQVAQLAPERVADTFEGELGGVVGPERQRHAGRRWSSRSRSARGRAWSAGRNACVIATWPMKLISSCRRMSSIGTNSSGPITPMPALFTSP